MRPHDEPESLEDMEIDEIRFLDWPGRHALYRVAAHEAYELVIAAGVTQLAENKETAGRRHQKALRGMFVPEELLCWADKSL